jgi:uncharacterized integral membrane protein
MVFVYVLVALLGAAAMVFTVQNPDPVSVTFFTWRTVSLPLSLLLMLSVFVGIVFASVSGFAREIQLKRKVRQLQKRIVELSPPGGPASPDKERAGSRALAPPPHARWSFWRRSM